MSSDQDSSFFDLGDKTALVCIDHLQYQKMIVPQLIDLGCGLAFEQSPDGEGSGSVVLRQGKEVIDELAGVALHHFADCRLEIGSAMCLGSVPADV